MSSETQIQLGDLIERIDNLADRGLSRSALRLARELQRRAKEEQDFEAYVSACFRLMIEGSHVLDPQLGRDAALELICVLENEDHARLIDPDLDMEDYEYYVWGRTSCAYDNLATNIGAIKGFNSDGMQQCIKDGLEVCRKTGKMRCTSCFRIYSIEVYAASDDLEMALHFANVAAMMDDSNKTDQRLNGRYNLVRWNPVAGRLEQAIAAAYDLIESLSQEEDDSVRIQAEAFLLLEKLELISGHSFAGQMPEPQFPPELENLQLDWHRDCNKAIRQSIEGDTDSAVQLLSKWDQVFLRREYKSLFFENRLQLLALLRFGGKDDHVTELADELVEHANAASDWLTVRLCETIVGSESYDRPVPSLVPFTMGPFATRSVESAIGEGDGSDRSESVSVGDADDRADHNSTGKADEESQGSSAYELPAFLKQFYNRIRESFQTEDDAARVGKLNQICEDLLKQSCDNLVAQDITLVLHCMTGVLTNNTPAVQVWSWARNIVEPHSEQGECLAMLADLGCALKFGAPDKKAVIDEEQLESLFRRAMALAPKSPNVFRQSGQFYRFLDQLGEAERCFARSFRLDRQGASVVLALADIYQRTDRSQDALAALDMSIRAGCESNEVVWEAVLLAYHQDRHVAALSYLDRYESQIQNNPWSSFYRTLALLELSRFGEAEAVVHAAEATRKHFPEIWLILDACVKGNLGQTIAFCDSVQEVLELRLANINALTPSGLTSLFGRLWELVSRLDNTMELKSSLGLRMIETGLACNEYFDSIRQVESKVEGLNYYECVVEQPLDDRWSESTACLAGQQAWTSYSQSWGVLASDESQAARFVLDQQRRCYHLPPNLVSTELISDGYDDSPGVCWQGYRENACLD